jgi:predicted MFS family arabinose efflux permease
VAEGDSGDLTAELMDGLRIVLSSGVLRILLVAGVLVSIGFAALQTLAVFFLRQNLHASPSLFGLLAGAQGAGALVGAALGGSLAERIGVGRLLWRAVILLGVIFVLFSRMSSFTPALALLFLTGATFAVMEVSESPLLMRATPRAHLGRVSAILFPIFGLASAGSAVAAGWLAGVLRGLHVAALGTVFGPLDTVIAGAGLLVIAGGVYARAGIGPVSQPSPPEG